MSATTTVVTSGQANGNLTLAELSQKPDTDIWQEAREKFDRDHRPRRPKDQPPFDDFLKSTESVDAARATCEDVQTKADAKYTIKERSVKGRVILTSDFVRTCLDNLNAFIKLGDLVVAHGPESVSAGWMAISFVLKAVKNDETNCKMWAEAAEVMSRILLNCKIFARLYSSGATGRGSTDGTQQLLLTIPKTYESILVFAWATKQQLDHSWVHRLGSAMNPFSEAAKATEGAFVQIKDFDEQMRQEALVAFQELQQASSIETRDEVKNLAKLWKERDQRFQEISDIAKRTEETSNRIEGKVDALSEKVLQSIKMTPEQLEQKRFDVNKSLLNPQDLSQRVLEQKYALKDKGTCEWIFQDAPYTAWHDTAVSDLLWLFAKGGYGKSVLMSNIIKHIQEEESAQNHTSMVTYFFCVNAGAADATHNVDRIRKDIIYALYAETKDNHDLLVEANRLFLLKDKKHQAGAPQTAKTDNKGQKSAASDGLPDLDELLVGLARLLKRRLFVAIDALDECVGDIDELFESLRYWLKAEGTDIKLVVSSRPEPHLVEQLETWRKIDVEEKTHLDVAKRTDAALAKIPGLDRSERKLVRSKIIEKAGGQFTYVNTATEFLRQPWDRPIENLLNRLQDNMDNLYQEALRNTDPRYMDLAKQALTWTLLRKGSLDVVHFFDVYSKRYTFSNKVTGREKSPEDDSPIERTDTGVSEPDSIASDTEDEDPADIEARRKSEEIDHYREQIAKAAGNMLVVNQHGFLEEKHQTVRECFLKDPKDGSVNTSEPTTNAMESQEHICSNCRQNAAAHLDFTISKEQGHLEIALSLLQSLNSSEFCEEFFHDSYVQEIRDQAERDETPEDLNVDKVTDEASPGEEPGTSPSQDPNTRVDEESENKQKPLDGSLSLSDEVPANESLPASREFSEVNEDRNTTENVTADDTVEAPQDEQNEETPQEGGEGEVEEVIRCVCDSLSKEVPTVLCSSCNTWQHIHCYFWPRDTLRSNKGHACVVCKPDGRSIDVEAARERQRVLDEPEPDEDFNDGDSDSEDGLDEVGEAVMNSGQAADSSALTQQPRYELYSWMYHLKEAERAAGRESTKDSELWQRVWSEARTFMTDRFKLNYWIKTVIEGPWATRFKFLCGNEPPLHVATAFGLTWVVKNLIQANEDVSETAAPIGEQPIHFLGYDADMNDDIELLDVLIEHNDPNVKLEDTEVSQALFSIIKNDPDLGFIQALHKHKVDWNIHNPNAFNWNVLHHLASLSTHPDIIPFLCQEAHVDINLEDDEGDTPLHLLMNQENIPHDLLKAFLEQGANVNAESHDSIRPLRGAAAYGELAAIKILFEYSSEPIEVNDSDYWGSTALHAAATYGHTDLVRYLVEKGADINSITLRGNTPFRQACLCPNDETALYLLDRVRAAGFTAEQIDLSGLNARPALRKASLHGLLSVVEELMQMPGMEQRLELTDSVRLRTPLHVAAWKGHEKIVKLLLSRGADHTKLDRQKKRPLQLCYEAWASSSKGSYEGTVMLLVNHDPEAAVGDTALLHAAATVGSTLVLRRLVEMGANLNTQDKHGWSPLQTTRHLGHADAADVLEHGLISGQRPTCLVPLRQVGVRPSTDPTVLRKYPAFNYVSFISDHPIPAGVQDFYFEIELRGGSAFAIGFTTHPGSRKWRDWLPGWQWPGVKSYGYHSNGYFECDYSAASGSNTPGPTFGRGDIVGCAVNFVTKTISFSLNGQWLGVIFENISGRLYPAVGMCGGESAFKVNFGQDPDTPLLRAGELDLVPGLNRYVDGESIPSRLLAPDAAVLRLLDDKFACEEEEFRYALLANHAIPKDLETYYFEVEVIESNNELAYFVAIGLTTQATYTEGWTPGWRVEGSDRRSYAYHGDDGNRFSWHAYEAAPGEPWSTYTTGDTVGCGIDMRQRRIFFTKNGELLGYPFKDEQDDRDLYPAVGFRGCVTFAVNLGLEEARPFKWAEANTAAWRKPMLGLE